MKKLLLVDYATLLYVVFTSLLLLCLWERMAQPWQMIALRMAAVAGVFLFATFYMMWPSRWTKLLRMAFPLVMLSVWYPETFEFSRHFANLDHLFASADLTLFGCEPAYEMSLWLRGQIWSELFNAGYASYFLMIALCALVPFFCKEEELERTVFVVTAGFFAYYVIYLFLPVAGPQFYFGAIDASHIAQGPFPELGYYFNLHPDAAIVGNDVPGFFHSLVELAHEGGERPVAAFPSSHVGMATVLMIFFYQQKRAVFYGMLPLYILLCGATVYIGAHYLVDVFGGWITGVLFYLLFNFVFRKYNKPQSVFNC